MAGSDRTIPAEDPLSAEAFERLVRQSSDIVGVMSPKRTVRYLSPAFEGITGIPPDEMVGKDVLDGIHPDDVPRVLAAIEDVIAASADGSGRVEFRRRHRDGRWLHLEAIGRNMLYDPAVRGIVVTSRDITERKMAELALRESETRFRALFEGTATAVTLRDLGAQRLFDCNMAAVRLFGCKSRDELLGTHPLELSPELQADGTPSPIAARKFIERARTEKAYQFEWLYRKVTGEVLPTEVQVTVIELEGRSLFLSIITDISATKAAEAAIVKAKEDAIAASLSKSAFLANMSHELRTPLNGVIGMVDLLAQTKLDERQRRYNDVARDSARLLLSVINDILDFSKIEAGKLDLEQTDFSLTEIVEEVAGILALSAEDKGLELICHADPALARPLTGDPARIRQVLVNLVNNAIKFTPRGEVSVSATVARESEAGVLFEVEVRDTGIGIAEDAQKKLFQPFSQLDDSSTRKHHGSGLGLAICRELVERMGGHIGVRSQPGHGSTFWFSLLLPRPTAGTFIDDSLALEARLAGLRVLGVDDNATNRELLQAELRAAGMICDTAPDGPSALETLVRAAATAPYAIAILDHHMPRMSGVELARRVKADDRIKGTRIVMLGSIGRPLDQAERAASGIVGYASKPIWRRQLLRVLSAAMDHAPDAPQPAAESPAPAVMPAVPGRRILLVEDSPISAEVTGEILRTAGYAFDLVVDGAQAVEAAQRGQYDLILMDCQLPVIDGYEATRTIRAREGTAARAGSQRVPIVALTASATKGDLERCLDVGMNDHVSKPVDARRLLSLIATHLASAPRAQAPLPARPAGHALAVADLAGALVRLQGNEALLQRIIARFGESAPDERARLGSALEQRDTRALHFAAHRLRGQISAFGAEALGARVTALEDAAKREDWTSAAAELTAIDQELERLLHALRQPLQAR